MFKKCNILFATRTSVNYQSYILVETLFIGCFKCRYLTKKPIFYRMSPIYAIYTIFQTVIWLKSVYCEIIRIGLCQNSMLCISCSVCGMTNKVRVLFCSSSRASGCEHDNTGISCRHRKGSHVASEQHRASQKTAGSAHN